MAAMGEVLLWKEAEQEIYKKYFDADEEDYNMSAIESDGVAMQDQGDDFAEIVAMADGQSQSLWLKRRFATDVGVWYVMTDMNSSQGMLIPATDAAAHVRRSEWPSIFIDDDGYMFVLSTRSQCLGSSGSSFFHSVENCCPRPTTNDADTDDTGATGPNMCPRLQCP